MNKERFEWRYNEEVLKHYIFDNLEHKQLAYKDIINLLNEQYQQNDQLKQQLAEKDCRIEELEGQFAYECECNKQLVELQKQLEKKQNEIDEINKKFVQAVHDWKALCAEKDKEIERLNTIIGLSQLQVSEKDRLNTSVNINSLQYNQNNQTQLAIQELEKVKEKINKLPITDILDTDYGGFKKIYQTDAIRIIDQQIKELKGEKDEV